MTPVVRASRRVASTRSLPARLPPLVKIPTTLAVGGQAASFKRPGSEELRGALEHALRRHFGGRRRIVTLKRRQSPYRSSFNLEELDVQLDDGTCVPIIFKDLSRGAMLKNARLARPDFLYHPRREIQTYRMILARHHLGTATCYGAVIDPRSGRYWLFLERVAGFELRHVGEFAAWQQAARWLADLHARFAPAIGPLRRAPELQLISHDADYYRLWLGRALAFARQSTGKGSRQSLERIEWLASRYDAVVQRLVALPVTLIHGEFYACNVWVGETEGRRRVCPVDWEMASVGPALIDLAALCAGWSEARRSALAMSYFQALGRRNEWPAKPREFFRALDCCQLHLSVRMLGWSSQWSAPPQHAHNWLADAMGLAKRLGL